MTQISGRCRPLVPALALLLLPALAGADEPYARSRDYDLQNVKTHLWFDLDQRKVRGEVTHTLAMLRDDVAQIQFDSVDLKIAAVTLDGKDAKFFPPPPPAQRPSPPPR